MKRDIDYTLYLVTDQSFCDTQCLEEIVLCAIRGGVTVVQLREKKGTTRSVIEQGRKLKSILHPLNVPLLINDRVDIAIACEADGVHIGQDDLSFPEARKILGQDALIGLSVETIDQVIEAEKWDVAYLGVNVFETPTKTNQKHVWGIEGLKRLRKLSRHKLVAIGGIHADNVAELIQAGAQGIAVVSAICGSPEPELAARTLRQKIEDVKTGQRSYCRVLTIAGSDSGGGAGIQADLKTFSALGCYGLSVLTALTAQNTKQVTSLFSVSPTFVADQLDAVLSDIGVDAIKIGMLHTPEIIFSVANRLKHYEAIPLVLDPVMIAKSGDVLLQNEAIAALKEYLFPCVDVITPNLPEASILLGMDVGTPDDMEKAARSLVKLGPKIVLLKGGHLENTSYSHDYMCSSEEKCKGEWLQGKRVQTNNTHGTGCTLSSAIAAFLAKGLAPYAAIKEAKAYVSGAIEAGAPYVLGHGHGPVHHFYKLWPS